MTVGMKKMTKRTAVAIGGALFALSYILAAFTTDLGLFYFAQGIVGGKSCYKKHKKHSMNFFMKIVIFSSFNPFMVPSIF